MIAVKSLNKTTVAIATDAVTAARQDRTDPRFFLFANGIEMLVDLEVPVDPVVGIA